ncbi:MAG: T9SS type A sorting domain-containing protein [Flavobacteriales bacterium]|nr:T9SS type A sorting domain-containing protein [Flavobacteriales bacterium]
MRALCLALLCFSASPILCQWQLVANGDQLPSAAFDGCSMYDEGVAVLTNTYSSPFWPWQSHIVRITASGSIIDSIPIQADGELAIGMHLYARDGSNRYFASGAFVDSSLADNEVKCFVAEVSDGQAIAFPHGPRFHEGGDGLGFIDPDGSLVYGYYHYQDFWTLEFTFRAVRHCPGVGACDSVLLNEQVGTGRVHAMAPLASGSIVALFPPANLNCSPSNDAMVILSPELDTVDCFPVPVIEPGAFNTNATFEDNLSALVLASGNLLLCGTYNRLMQPDPWNPVAVQRLTPEGELLAIRRFYNAINPAITMRPGIMRGMSAFDESTFAFAYADFAWQSSPWPYSTETSNIHVLKMDTAMNVLGEYVFNGDAINRYHFLSSVVASPDGAVYVVGSVYDYNDDTPMPKSWVARIGPEQFVSVPEATQAGFAIFPNPGTNGFNLRMANPITGAKAQIHDAQGRLLREQSLTDAQSWFGADGLPVGLYLVHVTASDGSRFTARWVKE